MKVTIDNTVYETNQNEVNCISIDLDSKDKEYIQNMSDEESIYTVYSYEADPRIINAMKYAGIGSRKTPPNILNFMTEYAKYLSAKNIILRSGGAIGADKAFEKGAGENKEIYYAKDATKESTKIAKQFHPCWDKLSQYAKKLHSRNVFQILGKNLCNPVDFLVCWTEDGCNSNLTRSISTGGTGTAISMADYYDIPIFNLKDPLCRINLLEFNKKIDKIKEFKKPQSNNTSGVSGINWDKASGKWRVRITINKKQTTIGYSDSLVEAKKIKELGIISI